MRFIVYGAGAIGSVVGGHLYKTGHDVVLVGNPFHIDKINEAGLRLVTPTETYVIRIPAYKKASELAPFDEKEDVLLLTAKSQQTLMCLGQLKNAGAPRTLPIFCVQNSITNEALATRIFDHVYGVMVRVGGIFLQPGEVINPVSGNAGLLEVGLYPRGSDELAHKVADAFGTAGFAGGVNEWVMRAKAAKCLQNLANAMGAVTNGREEDGSFMASARREAMNVWKAAGIEWEDAEEFNKRTRERRGATKMPKGYENIRNLGSSWQSLVRGTGNIEAEELNGDVVKLGRMLGIKAPYNEVLWRVAEEMAKNNDKPGKYSAEDLTRMAKEVEHVS
ncbi:ketopantoate reductase family protein [Candidatus Bathyarchaeota archaeon]|nr:ketopantoate reductase family protein [Candidatus Bathyarchaeota archaeon]